MEALSDGALRHRELFVGPEINPFAVALVHDTRQSSAIGCSNYGVTGESRVTPRVPLPPAAARQHEYRPPRALCGIRHSQQRPLPSGTESPLSWEIGRLTSEQKSALTVRTARPDGFINNTRTSVEDPAARNGGAQARPYLLPLFDPRR